MDGSSQEEEKKKKITEVKTFPVPFALEENQETISIKTNIPSNFSKEKIINQAINFHLQGNIKEAAKLYQSIINQSLKDHRVFVNYGVILKSIGKLKEAESTIRKGIKLKPDFANAHLNLGNILKDTGRLREAELSYQKAIKLKPDYALAYHNQGVIFNDLGKLKDAEFSYLKAIEINPDFAKSYFSISLLNYPDKNNKWKHQLFSKNILKNKLITEKVDIYFARANILHKEKNFKDSARYLYLANKLKLDIKPSKPENIYTKSKLLLIESDKKEINKIKHITHAESIFIVGMPRSGSTLLESILSMNEDVFDLGEINILEESFLEFKKSRHDMNLAKIYEKNVKNKTELNISTNKCLYNYLYTGIIANHIPNAKIIHCFRHPLDNILSIYRTNFSKGNEYSSSLIDSAKIYLNQDKIMTKYKNRFRTKIYDLNYDLLVSNPNKEIKSLISWLGWEWDDSYSTPHLNPRSVSTASNVQVRSPINSKSIGGWKNYKEMLKPAIEILAQTDKYKDIIS